MRIQKTVSFRLLAVAILTTTVLFTCKKIDDNSGGGNDPFPEPAPDLNTKVTASVVSGFVTNENDAAVLAATVEIGSTTVTTDKYGYFEVRNVQVTQNAATVTIRKDGYFKTVKTFIATAGKSVFFRIKLLPKSFAGSFAASAGGSVTLASGLVITIPAAAVVNAGNNASYTGLVLVAAQLLSAANPDINRIMPGDLRGLNTNGNLRLLTTYGMIAVELTGSNGELLQIASGKKATITLPIPASLQPGAPASIPLWYFDEAKGLWKEEGSATKTGSNYVGEVSHFSFWNCDVPANYVQFNCTVLNNAGVPIQGAVVKISVVNNPASFAYGYTDSSGYVAGAVPNNSQLLLEIFSSSNCAGVVHSQQFTTANNNISLGNISIAANAAQATITGNITNCINAPVTNGYVILQSGTTFIRKAVSNTGTFSINTLLCNAAPANVTLIGEDITALQQSIPASYTIHAGNNNAGTIQACGVATQQFVNFIVNGVPQNYSSPDTIGISLNGNNNIAVWYSSVPFTAWGDFSFTAAGIAAGSTQTLINLQIPQALSNLTILNPPVNVIISEYGAAGQYVAGNFSGNFTGPAPANTPYTISCSFRIKKYW